MKMITVTPVEGFRILNPDNGHTVLLHPTVVPDSLYWRQMERDKAVTITPALHAQ